MQIILYTIKLLFTASKNNSFLPGGKTFWLSLGIFCCLGMLVVLWQILRAKDTRRQVELEPVMIQAAQRNEVPLALLKAVIWKESRFKPNSRGSHGEIGLMQLMPIAIEQWRQDNKVSKTPSEQELFNPEVNVAIGAWYLAWCGRHWKGYRSQELLQVSEYNAGYRRVSTQWKPAKPQAEVPLSAITIKSTRKYTQAVLERRAYYEQLAASQPKN